MIAVERSHSIMAEFGSGSGFSASPLALRPRCSTAFITSRYSAPGDRESRSQVLVLQLMLSSV